MTYPTKTEGFDIPYVVNRTTQVLSRNDLSRYCLWDKFPRKRKYTKFGNEQETYDLIGRVHLDYLELYRKCDNPHVFNQLYKTTSSRNKQFSFTVDKHAKKLQ